MDVLSNVLQVTNLATRLLGARQLAAPWAIRIDAQPHAVVHIVRSGACWLLRDGAEAIRLANGDIVLLAHGDKHVLSSEREPRDTQAHRDAVAPAQDAGVPGRGDSRNDLAAQTFVQSANYEFWREGSHPVLALLPAVIHLRGAEAEDDGELQLLLRLLTREASAHAAGGDLVSPRLIESLFIYMLRAWLQRQPEGAAGWLGALRDPQIGKALALIHENPQAQWTVERLAHAVAMSRAAFAKRFTEYVGEPPLTYITRWRMDLASKLLRESREPVARIAVKVGYLSETAFAKAFRRRRKVAPGAYRHERLGPRKPSRTALSGPSLQG
jgi:AraC-like DNA-binding protein